MSFIQKLKMIYLTDLKFAGVNNSSKEEVGEVGQEQDC
mgnify:CR=1 FL=1